MDFNACSLDGIDYAKMIPVPRKHSRIFEIFW